MEVLEEKGIAEKITAANDMARAMMAKKLTTIRRERGLSQSQAAELCEMSWKTYGRAERGEGNFTLLTLMKICVGLNLSAYDLLEEFVCQKDV